MRIFWAFICILTFLGACKNNSKDEPFSHDDNKSIQNAYAKGFEINKFENYKTLTIKNPWPGATNIFTYALIEKGATLSSPEKFDAIIEVPISSIVVTSTTHIPSLEMLGVLKSLVGFPNLDYISSEATRELIDEGRLKELGKNDDINTEVLLELSPDAVITYSVDGINNTATTIQKTGIPVLYNADWTETSPLGKAEWIKFFGVLFDKEQEADSIFQKIEREYEKAKEIALRATSSPTVLGGAMYRDIWYLPRGDSWAAQLIEDANGNYLWKESEGTGSLALSLEAILEKGQHAHFWLAPGQFKSLTQMKEAHIVYSEFNAFKENKVFNFTNKIGTTGGVIYYELAPNRPDLVLKDLIKILHPELLPEYDLYFFSKLE